MNRILFIAFIWMLLVPVFRLRVSAQNITTNVAAMVEVNGEVSDGDLICSTLDGMVACNTESDTGMFGVITLSPAAVIRNRLSENAKPILTTGMASVRVSSRNGVIRKGQYVTSSETPGVAQLATENGYVLGTAMADYVNDDPNVIGIVPVVLNIHLEAGISNARSNLIAVLQQSRKAAVFAPLDSLRYLVAALLVILSFVMGFIYFGKTTSVGVEAIGRNPLAKRQIQSSMLIHFIVTFVVIGIGIISAYIILIL